MCNTCYKNTTNTTGGFCGQTTNGFNGGCHCRRDTVTVPIYGTVTIPLYALQGTTGENGQNTQNTQNGCGCQKTWRCRCCHCRQNCCNGCFTTWNVGNACGNVGGNTRCGRGVAESIVTGDAENGDTTEIRYGYYPYGYYPYGGGGCGCVR